ncbi:MAG TPA: hypothetical protein VMY78_04795 [Solirubrobacteraceae bacterium]|nr:hypothetical protein [Solirubrobacteraceae bacterium]
MGSTRALFASIGVSVSLVAAAALSLFTVSVVIAFGGWSAGMGSATTPQALVFDGTTTTAARSDASRLASARPVVMRAPAQPRPQRAEAAPARAASAPARATNATVVSRRSIVSQAPQYIPPADPPAAKPAPAPVSHAGDGVRRVGEGLSSTAQKTGSALGDVTAPLGPPVSEAVQKVLDLVAAVLQRTTNGLGGTLDKVAQR